MQWIPSGLSDEAKTSALVLVAANLLPLYGLLFLNWNPRHIFAGYVAEGLFIFLYGYLKIGYAASRLKDGRMKDLRLSPTKFFYWLCWVGFVFALMWSSSQEAFYMAVTFFVSHGLSFFLNVVRQSEYLELSKTLGYGIIDIITALQRLFAVGLAILGLIAGVPPVLMLSLKVAVDLYHHLLIHSRKQPSKAV